MVVALSEKTHTEEELMKNPKLYMETTGNRKFKWHYFTTWMTLGLYHSCIIYFFTFYLWRLNPALLTTPHTLPLFSFGCALCHNAVVIVNLKLLLKATYKTHLLIYTIIFSIVAFMLTTFVYNILPM